MIKKITCLAIICLALTLIVSCTSKQTATGSDTVGSSSSFDVSVSTSIGSSDESTSADSTQDSVPFDVVLKDGDEGDAVYKLQKKLAELKFFNDKVNGIFGSTTTDAVKAFQEANNLDITGVADQSTQEVLYSKNSVSSALPLSGYIIGIDPGHQAHGNSELEPVAPGSKEKKKKVSDGTEGCYTHIPEYQVNLDVGLLLRDLLEAQGATVIMTRETNDVNITNIERAELFNENETDYALRLHCDGKDDKSVHGAFMLVPTENPFLAECDNAAEILLKAYCEETGAKNMGLKKRSDQTGFNWCKRMIINIEMGHMSNKEEDIKLTDPKYQKKMAQGLCNGILEYFESYKK